MSKLRKDYSNEIVFEAITKLQTKEECYKFFSILCTQKELEQIAMRLYVAKLLYEGATYRKINELVSVANVTISRVKTAMENENGIINKVLNSVERNSNK